MNRSQKRVVIAIFFLLVPLLTLAPFLLFRSPTADRVNYGIAVCNPQFNPGPQGVEAVAPESSYSNYLDRIEQIVGLSSADKEAFKTMGGLLSYDKNLAEFWHNATLDREPTQAITMTLDEARRLSSNPDYAPCVIR